MEKSLQWYMMAKRYLIAAQALLRSEECKKIRVLYVPTLHLTLHGIEILLKANLLESGLTVKEVRDMNHNILKLWAHDKNKSLRRCAETVAKEVWEDAKNSKRYEDNFIEDPWELLQEYLKKGHYLHTSESEYALRYVSDRTEQIPRPFLLLETFLKTADLVAKNPNNFIK